MDWCESRPDRNWGWFVSNAFSNNNILFPNDQLLLCQLSLRMRNPWLSIECRKHSICWHFSRCKIYSTFWGVHLDVTGQKTQGSLRSTLATHLPGCYTWNWQHFKLPPAVTSILWKMCTSFPLMRLSTRTAASTLTPWPSSAQVWKIEGFVRGPFLLPKALR